MKYIARDPISGLSVNLETSPMTYEGEEYEAVDLEPHAGYALYLDLAATIREVGDDLDAILQSADAYTDGDGS